MPRKKSKSPETVPIYLPQDLVASARLKLEDEREIELETFISIYLRMILRTTKGTLGLDDEIRFGKYYGEKVNDVVRVDPHYIAWIVTQPTGRTKFAPEVLILLDELMSQ